MADALHCPKCNNAVEENAVFCPYCGFKMVHKDKRPKAVPLFTAALAVVVLLICVFVFSGLTIVPEVVGSSKEDAVTALQKKGLHVEFVAELTDDVEENIVY